MVKDYTQGTIQTIYHQLHLSINISFRSAMTSFGSCISLWWTTATIWD
jgi:hypothetical protein